MHLQVPAALEQTSVFMGSGMCMDYPNTQTTCSSETRGRRDGVCVFICKSVIYLCILQAGERVDNF